MSIHCFQYFACATLLVLFTLTFRIEARGFLQALESAHNIHKRQVTDVCASQPCHNGGSCILPSSATPQPMYWCVCPSGFIGFSCEIAVGGGNNNNNNNGNNGGTTNNNNGGNNNNNNGDGNNNNNNGGDNNNNNNNNGGESACASSPCLHGDCESRDDGSYSCQCLAGFAGAHCELDESSCFSNPCINGGTCFNRVGGYQCFCIPGYYGDRCELVGNFTIRLVDGSSPSNGRLEVQYKGVWGTVCDDFFNNFAAEVACRQLGYTGGTPLFGSDVIDGSGPIWMHDVECIGYETSIAYCRHRGYGCCNDCFHDEDVGVSCNSEEATTLSPITIGGGNTEQTTELPVEGTTEQEQGTTEGITIGGGNTEEQTTEMPVEPTVFGFTNLENTVETMTEGITFTIPGEVTEESTVETTGRTIQSGGGEQTTVPTFEETTQPEIEVSETTQRTIESGGGGETTEPTFEQTTELETTQRTIQSGGGEMTTEPSFEGTTELVVGGGQTTGAEELTTMGPVICNCPNEEFQTTESMVTEEPVTVGPGGVSDLQQTSKLIIAASVVVGADNTVGQSFLDSLDANAVQFAQFQDGGQWISLMNFHFGAYSNQVVSCFYHPSRDHWAATVGSQGSIKSVAAADDWACSIQTAALCCNQATYGFI